MPRQPRDDQAGQIYHALNRGNQRQTLFHKDGDFVAFERVLAEGLAKYPVELFAYTLMPNHCHLVLRPAKNGRMGRLGLEGASLGSGLALGFQINKFGDSSCQRFNDF